MPVTPLTAMWTSFGDFTHNNVRMVLYILLFVFSGNAWGQEAQSITDLRNRLRNLDKNSEAREEILVAIGEKGKEAEPAIPDLIEILRDHTENKKVRGKASVALEQIGASSVPALIKVIDDVDKVDSYGRILACNILGGLGEAAKEALPKLIETLSNKLNDVVVRASTANAIGEIGIGSEDTVKALIEALDVPEARLRNAATFALGELKEQAKSALPKLIALLRNRDEDPTIRTNAAAAIGKIGIPSKEALAQLAETKNNDPDNQVRGAAADSLKSLSWWTRFLVLLEKHPVYSLLAGTILLLALGVAALFLFAPLWLLHVNESLMPITDITLPWFGGIKLPVRYLFLVGFFHYRPRVLDAWVSKHISKARETFAQMLVQKKQDIYVKISVDFNDRENPSEPTEAKLQTIFEIDISHLLISGDGGIGKTNLACELGRWAMADKAGQRLCPTHLMLPILLEDFKGQKASPEAFLLSKIQNSLKTLIQKSDKPSSELVRHLLKHRRLLLIIDSLSEMDSEARADIITGVRDVPVNALIVTSRTKKDLGELQPKVITPQKLSRSNLNVFVDSYLKRKEKLQLFTDQEFQDACSKLISIVGESAVTVLLAKLFVDQLIANKESPSASSSIKEFPQTIPDLMVNSIEILNRHETKDSFDTKVIIVAAKAMAWRSLEETLNPSSISYQEALDVIRREEVSAELLNLGIPDSHLDDSKRSLLIKYLENIGIIKIFDHYPKHIRFTIDALSEYLAGLYLMNKYGRNQREWNRFLSKASRLKGKGFILALKDCCQSKRIEFKIPELVVDKLSELLKEIEAEEAGKENNSD